MTLEYFKPLTRQASAKSGVLFPQAIPQNIGAANRRRAALVGCRLAEEKKFAWINRRLCHLVV